MGKFHALIMSPLSMISLQIFSNLRVLMSQRNPNVAVNSPTHSNRLLISRAPEIPYQWGKAKREGRGLKARGKIECTQVATLEAYICRDSPFGVITARESTFKFFKISGKSFSPFWIAIHAEAKSRNGEPIPPRAEHETD